MQFSKKIYGLALLATLTAASLCALAQEPAQKPAQPQAATATAQAAPAAPVAQTVQAAPAPAASGQQPAQSEQLTDEERQNNLFRLEGPVVKWTSRTLHIPVETTAILFEVLNFLIIALVVGIPLVRILPGHLRNRKAKLASDIESARKMTEDANARLSAVEAEGESALQPAEDRVPALERAASGAAPLPISAPPAQPPYTPLVARAVQLAAMAALGEAGDESYDRLTTLTVDDTTHTCLHIAKLNLYQCLAVAKPNYEDVFCMGQHVMMDTGSCLVKNVGLATPVEVTTTPMPAAVSIPAKKSHHSG